MTDYDNLVRRLRNCCGVGSDDPECNCNEAADAIKSLQAERVDWARRFKLNDITPWEWMTRALAAEAKVAALQAQVESLTEQIEAENRADRQSRDRWLTP